MDMYWARMWWKALKYFLGNVKDDGFRRALAIFWSNWQDRTHLFRTNIPPGVWKDYDTRVENAARCSFVEFVNTVVCQDMSDGERLEWIEGLKADHKLAEAYLWFARDRDRAKRVRDYYAERYPSDMLLLKIFGEETSGTPEQEIACDRHSHLDWYIQQKDKEMTTLVLNNLDVMHQGQWPRSDDDPPF